MPRFICQIYEVQHPAEARQLVALGVDHIGSVLLADAAAPSNALVAETIAAVRRAGAVSSLIPLFSNREQVLEALDRYRPDIVHFCEALDPAGEGGKRLDNLAALQREVRRVFPGTRIMRSIPIAPPGQAHQVPTLELAERFAPVSDIFLTDTFLTGGPEAADQPVSGFVGITGRVCDWDMARLLVEASPLPVILAGGIGPQNARDGLRRVRPWGVDSCTGTNAVGAAGKPIRFRKDFMKVEGMVQAVRRAEADPGGNDF